MKTTLRLVARNMFPVLLILAFVSSSAQTGVLNPNDPIVVYNPASPPATPPANTLAKWVKSNRLSWETSSYKAYYYNGVAFRLKFPKSYQHGVSDGKTYPLFIFWHGYGERGNIYDNEYQLYHGGDVHRQAVDQGAFDGFLLYPQNQWGYFGVSHYDIVREIITKYLVPQVKVDINRIIVNGLSAGGSSCWDWSIRNPTMTAASTPISAALSSYRDQVNTWKYVATWHFQGGRDQNPHPSVATSIQTTANANGANYRLTVYPTQGHGIWYSAWGEPNYFPFIAGAHMANPWPYGGKAEFCPGEVISAKLGVAAGLNGYEWRRNGVLIPGASTNEITVTSEGTYDCRIRRGSTWSVWSPTPVIIRMKTGTPIPNVAVSGLMSKVIPAPDGKTFVTLQASSGYTSYSWQKPPSTTTLGSSSTYNATSPGDYIVRVTEQFGFASVTSAPFTVVDANGPNKPDPATNVTVTPVSLTELQITWNQNPTPAYNETNFEVYGALTSGGPYQLVGIKDADVLSHNIQGLTPNTRYYFIVRAVNSTGAAPVSIEATGSTGTDATPPSIPQNLTITSSEPGAVGLQWSPSTDDKGVYRYDIYINGVKTYSTANTQYAVVNLSGATSTFTVTARDVEGNTSGHSNSVTTGGSSTTTPGLSYKYYHGSWTALPDFSTLTPEKTGTINNFYTTPATQSDNFGFLWEGMIYIPVTGTYTFGTASDAGSKVYIGPYSHGAAALVNNDGLHDPAIATGTINLTQGYHPIAVTYFDQVGGEYWQIAWIGPWSGGNWEYIPDANLVTVTGGGGTVPVSNNIYINYNRDNPAGAPWYNTNTVPQLGAIFSLTNDLGKPAGVQFEITKNFSGDNPFGMNTGNNSGVYPDNVIRSSWWLDAGVSSQLRFSGLNQTLAYTFTFFGSRDGDGNRTTVYRIGSQSVSLNCSFNISNTVTIQNVQPDANGEVFVDISLASGATFGYLGAIVIKGYQPGSTPPAERFITSNEEPVSIANRSDRLRSGWSVYPNPFAENLSVSIYFEKPASNFTLRLVDQQGRIVWNRQYGKAAQGLWQQNISLNSRLSGTGLYMLQLLKSDGSKPQTMKLFRK